MYFCCRIVSFFSILAIFAMMLPSVFAENAVAVEPILPLHSGDLNNNGSRNVTDIQCGILIALGGDSSQCQAFSNEDSDLQCDGSFDITDVQYLIKVVLYSLTQNNLVKNNNKGRARGMERAQKKLDSMTEQLKTTDYDLDMIHNGCDEDDDNDGYADVCEIEKGTSALDENDYPETCEPDEPIEVSCEDEIVEIPLDIPGKIVPLGASIEYEVVDAENGTMDVSFTKWYTEPYAAIFMDYSNRDLSNFTDVKIEAQLLDYEEADFDENALGVYFCNGNCAVNKSNEVFVTYDQLNEGTGVEFDMTGLSEGTAFDPTQMRYMYLLLYGDGFITDANVNFNFALVGNTCEAESGVGSIVNPGDGGGGVEQGDLPDNSGYMDVGKWVGMSKLPFFIPYTLEEDGTINYSGNVAFNGNSFVKDVEILDVKTGAMSFEIDVWGGEVAIYYGGGLDLSKREAVQLKFTGYGNKVFEADDNPVFVQLYDDNWGSGESNKIYLPAAAFNGEEVTVTAPLEDFDNGTFDPGNMRHFIIGTPDNSGYTLGMNISEINWLYDESTVGLPLVNPWLPPTNIVAVEPSVSEPVKTSIAYLVTNSIIEVVMQGDVDLSVVEDPANWSVSGSGGTKAPMSVGRFTQTINVDENYNGVHDSPVNGPNNDAVVQRHTMYLELPSELVMGSEYTVSVNSAAGKPYYYDGTNGFLMNNENFGPWELTVGIGNGVAKAIKVNQHGYSDVSQERYAYAGYWMGNKGALEIPGGLPFRVYEVGSGEVALEDTISERGYYAKAGEYVYDMDLSGLGAGKYYIEVPGIGRSYVFQVGGTAFEAFYHVARAIFHERAGVELKEENTDWIHPLCHNKVYVLDEEDVAGYMQKHGLTEDPFVNYWNDFPLDTPTPSDKLVELTGGWYDAGDFDRRPMHMTVVARLLMLAEMFPGKMTDNMLNIPESVNGLPDVVDEALFGLQLWEQLQEEDGGVRSGVQTVSHPGNGTCEQDSAKPYWAYSPNQEASYEFAAVAAQASRVLESMDVARSGELLVRAEKAWNWAESHGANDDSNEAKFWAAGELFATTDNPIYQNAYMDLWSLFGNGTYHANMYRLWGMAIADGPNVDKEFHSIVMNKIFGSADEYFNNLYNEKNKYRYGSAPQWSTAWGSATSATTYASPFIMAYYFDPKQEYIDAVALNADFQLGANPNGISWITGMGSRPPEFPLLHNAKYDSVDYTIPGFSIDGPFEGTYATTCGDYYAPNDNWKCRAYDYFYPILKTLPAFRHYAPWSGMAAMNEFAIWTSTDSVALAYGFLYAVSGESVQDLSGLRAEDYPLNAGE